MQITRKHGWLALLTLVLAVGVGQLFGLEWGIASVAAFPIGMIVDAENTYSVGQTLTATGVSTNVIDHGSDRNIGIGEPLAVVITVTAIDAASADETYTAQLQTDDNVGFSSPTSVGGALTIPRTTAAGTRFVIPVPPDTATERFTRLNYTLGGTTPSITLTARLIPAKFVQNEGVFPDAITIG